MGYFVTRYHRVRRVHQPLLSSPNDPAGEEAKPGSDRSFGVVMAAAFAVITMLKLWHESPWWWVWLTVGTVFAAAAWLSPSLLRQLNYVWFRFGLLLHRVINPIVMAVLFFGAVLPVGLLMRCFGNHPLTPKFEPDAQSYWVPRRQDTKPGSMKNRF